MSAIHYLDEVKAARFFETHDLDILLKKYGNELDQELRDDPVKLANYLNMRLQGTARKWAAMSACRRAARMSGSDLAFNQHERRKMQDLPDWYRKRITQAAHKAGINTEGKFYVGGLGRYNDPAAWVSTIDDVRTVLKTKKLACEGLINYDPGEPEPVKPAPLAEDVVTDLVAEELAHDPGLASRCRGSASVLASVRREVRARYCHQPKST